MFWEKYEDNTLVQIYVVSDVPKLAETYDLAMTGKSMIAAFGFDNETKRVLDSIEIFAQMTPDYRSITKKKFHSTVE